MFYSNFIQFLSIIKIFQNFVQFIKMKKLLELCGSYIFDIFTKGTEGLMQSRKFDHFSTSIPFLHEIFVFPSNARHFSTKPLLFPTTKLIFDQCRQRVLIYVVWLFSTHNERNRNLLSIFPLYRDLFLSVIAFRFWMRMLRVKKKKERKKCMNSHTDV